MRGPPAPPGDRAAGQRMEDTDSRAEEPEIPELPDVLSVI